MFDVVRKTDVLIENYCPGVMPRLVPDYDKLRRFNPQLIMLSISGFDRDGPESQHPACAPIVHAEEGLIDRAARRGNIPHRDLPLSVADTNASLHGLVALLSAVILRRRTGTGQHIEVSKCFEMAHEMRPATVLCCYLRNPAFKSDKDYHVCADLTGQANHLGVTIQADIIKHKLAENNGGYTAISSKENRYGKVDERMYADRKAFQRPMKEGVGILNAIQDVYLSRQITVA